MENKFKKIGICIIKTINCLSKVSNSLMKTYLVKVIVVTWSLYLNFKISKFLALYSISLTLNKIKILHY